MRSVRLDARTAHDIEEQISRIHRDLDYVDGEIALNEVRDLLKLDLQYYTAGDPSLVDAVVHKLRVAGKQVIRRPRLLLEAIQKLSLRALFVPDRKIILLDSDLPELKKRWSEGHEIGHSVIPWHSEYMLGDTTSTLSPACHYRIECEANHAASRLLFPRTQFLEKYQGAALTIKHVQAIARHFGNTITSTFWRCVEASDQPVFGIIGEHPRYRAEGQPVVQHLVRSESFEDRFSSFGPLEAEACLLQYCGYKRRGPLGSGEVCISDDHLEQHVFSAESFSVSHYTLSLLQYKSRKSSAVAFSRVA